jgi:isoquinoline 1-oxidoreductase alpha subunit
MSASSLLSRTPRPNDTDIDRAMNGNICRCATYLRIRQAIHRAAQMAAADVNGGRRDHDDAPKSLLSTAGA